MSDLRRAAQQALEALEFYRDDYRDIDGGTRWDWTDQAIKNLRAALAEPVQKPEPHPEDYEIAVLRQQIATYQAALDEALWRKHGSQG